MSISLAAFLVLLATPPGPAPDPRELDPSVGAAQGVITFTRRSAGEIFTDSTTVTVKGTWRMPFGSRRGGVGCGPGRATLTDPLSYGGMKGTLSYEKEVIDHTKTDTGSMTDEAIAELKKEPRRKRTRAVRAVNISAKQNNEKQVALEADKFAMLGCLYLDEKNKKFVFDSAMFTTLGNMMEPADLSLEWWNEFGQPLAPVRSKYADTISSGHSFEGSYDPANPVLAGTLRDKEVDAEDRLTHGQDGHDHREAIVTYRFSLKAEGSVKVIGPACICGDHVSKSWTAQTDFKGGAFEKFELTSEGASPLVVANAGGQSPKLELMGTIAATRTKVVGVYKTAGGKLERSEPFEVSFCDVADPVPVASGQGRGNQRDYFFDGSKLEIDVKAKVMMNGKDVSDEARWDLSPNTGALFAIDPLQGKKAKLKASRLPFDNKEFGKKAVKASYSDSSCSCEKEHELRVFFPRDGTANPDGRMPNWAYYWNQTLASIGMPFRYSPTSPGQSPCGPSLMTGPADPRAAAHYDYCTGQLWVANVPKIGCFGRGGAGVDEDTGIDCFAVALRHENQHKIEFTKWWGVGLPRYSLLEDSDSDLVPNAVERDHRCDPKRDKSCPTRIDPDLPDMEFDSYQAGWAWQRGTADEEDWAFPGKQWPP